MIINPFIFTPPPPYTGRTLGDDFTMQIFHSLSQVYELYSGALIRSLRDSDNAETDVFPDIFGELSMTSPVTGGGTFSTWVSSDSAFETVFYNQGLGGSTWDLITTTTSFQPRIVNAGTLETVNGKAALRYDATHRSPALTIFADMDYPNAWTNFIVSSADAGGQFAEYDNPSGVRNFIDSRITPNRHIGSPLIMDLSTSYNNTNQVLKVAIFDGANSEAFDNGNAGGSGTMTTYTNTATYRLGAAATAFYLQEAFVISSNASSDRVAIETEIINYYSIP